MTDDIDQVAEGDPDARNPLCWYCDLELQPDLNDEDHALICPVHGVNWLPPHVAEVLSRLEKRAIAYLKKRGETFYE